MQGRQGQAARRGGAGTSRPVNYNDLMLQGAAPSPSPSPQTDGKSASRPAGSGARGSPHQRLDGAVTSLSDRPRRAHAAPVESGGGSAEFASSGYLLPRGGGGVGGDDGSRPTSSFRGGLYASSGGASAGSPSSATGLTSSTNGTGFLEGPLPPEVRQLIDASCRSQGQPASVQDEAERQARRLLSTNRRVRVYREELQAAVAESTDLEGVLARQHLVTQALHGEIDDIDAQIARLLREKQLCEAQLAHEQQDEQHQQSKLAEAQERVSVLRNTVDVISAESQRGYLMLRQLVPNLNIDNYT